MDGLSGAASVIAVVQIAVQIGQGISKMYVMHHNALKFADAYIALVSPCYIQ